MSIKIGIYCIENLINSKKYFVYDTVQIDGNVPTCSGYQFKGWEIITSGVKKVTDTTFVMPEQNVILRAIWTKLNVTKSMDGTVVKIPTLYDLIAGNSIGLDTNVDFSSNLHVWNSPCKIYYECCPKY